MENEALYPCVSICTPDPDSGYCLGCGRPLWNPRASSMRKPLARGTPKTSSPITEDRPAGGF